MSPNARRTSKLTTPIMRWMPLAILALTVTGTIIAWQQAVRRVEAETKAAFDAQVRNATNAINERVDTYGATLQGFRGLFHSSESVNEKEFNDYFKALDLQRTHPGFRTINFVARVTPDTKDTFLAGVRTDRSLNPQGNAEFAITPAGNRSEYFVVTYTGVPGEAVPKGTDLRQNKERRTLLETAMRQGVPLASTTVELISTNGGAGGPQGFLVTIPIYKDSIPATPKARVAAAEGFVNINFTYEALLKDTLKTIPAALTLKVYDRAAKDAKPLYQQGKTDTADTRKRTQRFSIAGREWVMEIEGPHMFGLTQSTKQVPQLVLAGGAALSGALVLIFWLLSRSRTRALKLAAAMTIDLQNERNAALAAKVKDEAILTSIGDGVFALDTNNNIVLFNKAAAQLSGYTAREALGQPLDVILRFRDKDGTTPRTEFIAKAQAGESAEMARHTILIRKDGTPLPVADSAAPIFGADGKQQGVIVVFRDITAEARFQQALEASNERFTLASQATNDVVYDLDLVNGTLTWNDALYSQYGYQPEKTGATVEWWTEHVHPDDAMRLNETFDKLNKKDVSHWTVEYRFQKGDGAYVYVRDRAFVQRDTQGQALRLIGSMLDITQQKQLDQAKDEFVSLVSHQLRTPLTAIRLFVEMLAKEQVGKLNGQQKDYLSKVQISTERMIRLVSDILNVSRIELGRIKIEPVPTDIPTLIQSHIEEVQPLADSKRIPITFASDAGLQPVNVDPTIFGQVVHNLLTNAIRYSLPQKGKVEVAFHQSTDGFVLSVRDSGIGIPEVARPRIFERFFRADNAIRTEGEGTGLGLYLIKMIMDAAGGTIWFESQEGAGTTFYAQLPPDGMKAKRGEKTLN